MAKKTNDDEFDLDNGEFDNFDDFDSFDPEPPKDDRTPTTKVKDAILEGAKDAVTDPKFVKNFVRSALPEGYGDAIELSSNIYGKTRSLYNEATQVIKPGLKDFARATKTLLPKVEKYIPASLAKKLKELGEDENEYRARTRKEEDEDTISGSLNEIFEAQSEQQAYTAQRQSAEASILDTKEEKRHTGVITLLQEIANLENRAAGFRDSIVYKYQRKSLELQYRSYFTQRDTHELLGASSKTVIENLAAIAKNTGLPEYVKQNTTEEGRKFLRDKMIGKVGQKFTDWSGSYLENLFKNIKETALNVAQGASDNLSGAADAIEQMRQAEEMAGDMGGDPKDMRRQMLGRMIGGTAADWIGTKVGKVVRKYTDQNPNIVATGQKWAYGLRNHAGYLDEFAKSDTDFSKPGASLLEMLKWNMPTYNGNNTQVENNSINKAFEANRFDNQTHQTINEIIPGFLSRQLQSLEGIRTGNPVERTVWNSERQEFTTYGQHKEDVSNKILGQNSLKYTDHSLQTMADQIAGGEGKLSAKGNKHLKERLLKQSIDGGRFNPEDYATDEFWGPEVEEEVKEELRAIFQQRYGIDWEGKVGTDDKSQTNRNNDDKVFQLMSRYLPNVGENVNKYANTGHRDILRDLGLLYKERTNDLVDSRYLLKRYTGEVGTNGANNGDGRSEGGGAGGRNGPMPPVPGDSFPNGNRDSTSTPPTPGPQADPGRVVVEEVLGDRFENALDNNTSRLIEAIRLNSASGKVEETNKLVGGLLELLQTRQSNNGGSPAPSGHKRSIGGAIGWAADSAVGLGIGTAKLGWRTGLAATRGGWWAGKQAARLGWGTAKLAGGVAAMPFRGLGRGYDALSDRLSGIGKKLTDLYQAGKESPVLEVAKLRAGEYYDSTTKKVLKSWNDIQGDILDAKGNVIVRYEDLKKDVTDRYGKRFSNSKIVKDLKAQKAGAIRYFGKKRTLLESMYKKARVMDVYVRGLKDPVLTAAGFERGDYLDFATRKVISYVDDISGPVCDQKGNLLLTAEQLKVGIFDVNGKKIRSGLIAKLLGGGRSVVGFLTKGFTAPIGLMTALPKAVWNKASVPWDVYSKADMSNPKLLAKLILSGQYRSKTTGKVIKGYGDIDGPIEDLNGNLLLTLEDIKAGLVNRFGMKLANLPRKLLNLAFGAVGFAVRKGFGLARKGLAAGMKVGKAVGTAGLDFLGRLKDVPFEGLGALFRKGKEKEDEASGWGSGGWLKKIYKLLDDRMPGKKRMFDTNNDGTRDNSVADILKQRAAKLKDRLKPGSAKDEPKDKEKSWLGWMLGMLMTGIGSLVGGVGSLVAGLKKWLNPLEWLKKLGNGGDMLDSAGDLLDGDGPDIDNDRRQRRGRGRRPPRGPRPRGKFGKALDYGKRLWDRAADSKYGKQALDYGRKGLNYGKDVATRGASWLKNSNTARTALQWGSRLVGLGGGGAGETVAATGARFLVTNAIRTAVVSTAGTMLAGAGAVAGTTAGAVVLTVAAVAAVGYGAYKGYQWWQSRSGPLTELRMLQYGFDPASDQAGKIRDLESELEDHTTVSNKGEVTLDDKLDYADLMEDFDVDINNQDQVRSWTGWFTQRFKPVYLKSVAMLKSFDPKAKLERVDRIEDHFKGEFATKVQNCGGAYDVLVSPFPGVEIKVTPKAISDKVAAIVAEFPNKSSKVASGFSAIDGKGIYRPGASAAGGASKPTGVKKDPKGTVDLSYYSETEIKQAKAKGLKLRSGEFLWQNGQNRTIDDLAGIRLRAYGLSELKVLDVNAITALELELDPKVEYSWFDNASMDVDPVALYNKFATQFSCDPGNEQHRTVWIYWFVNRFTPVWLNFCSAVRKADKYANTANAYKKLKPDALVEVAKVLVDTTASMDGDDVSVWSVAASPFPDQEANLDQSSVSSLLAALRDKQNSDKIKELNIDAKTGIANPSTSSVNYGQYNLQNRGGGGLSNYGNNGYNPGTQSNKNSTKSSGGFWSNLFGGSDPDTSGDQSMGSGRSVDHPGNGTGGDINSLPIPKGDGWDNVKDLILAASKMVGVDPGLMATMASIESTFRTKVKADTSSATGLYQFIDKTWKGMVAKYGAKYGIAPNTPPSDPRANVLMGAEFLKENSEYLSGRIGRQPTDNDLYLAHFMGKGGAVKLLTSSPTDNAAQIFPEQAAANQSIFYTPSKVPRTIAQVYQEIDSRVSKHSKTYGMAAKELAATGKAVEVKAPATGAEPGIVTETKPTAPTLTPASPTASADAEKPKASNWGSATPAIGGGNGNTQEIDTVFRAPRGDVQSTPAASATEVNNTAKSAVNAAVTKSQDRVLDRNQNTVVQQQVISDIQRSSTSREASKGITDLKDVSDEHLKIARSMDKTMTLLLEEVRGLRNERAAASSKSTPSDSKPTNSRKSDTKRKELPVEMGFRR